MSRSRVLLSATALLVALLLGAAIGVFAYVWHEHEKHPLPAADRQPFGDALDTIRSLCLGPAGSPSPQLTAAQREQLRVQTQSLVEIILRNPDYREVFRGDSQGGSLVGWLPQIQVELYELARCHAEVEYESLMNAALSTM